MSCLGLAFLPYTGESNTQAILFRTSSSCSGKYSPLYSILPAQASFKRMMVLISVVLPAPLRPMSPVMQPFGTRKVILSSLKLPKSTVRPCVSSPYSSFSINFSSISL